MELTQGNLQALYVGLQAIMLKAVKEAPIPASVRDFIQETPSTGAAETYPTGVLLGDIEILLDEYTSMSTGKFMQEVPNAFFGRFFDLPRLQVESDQIGSGRIAAQSLGRKCATHPYRRLPQLFLAGHTTAWAPDGANVWSAAHTWVGGQAWSNLNTYALTRAAYREVRRIMASLNGPDGECMDLSPTHLIVGPSNETMAKAILAPSTLGEFNPDADPDVKIVRWGALQGAYADYWFVADESDVKTVVVQNREAPSLNERSDPKDDPVWRKERIEYKVARCYGRAIIAPWTVQAQTGTETFITTTPGE